ncbi:hypothetical protein M409DRAFT_53250 [Zasmidium cellare ATCC 36951]|uniref:Hydrophobic surface binding protein A n=1 Tax=Zasmidium cellare ATCC 36951 TaxID=1080233 RepID=A0A6A6CR28_ZASCE|nr:uncharacterized protein M409DRAFT_53250 [Zasmidium cellare ATCC 36951]KAF2168600.1 hypothetical protein M409DRAFT_53250 [Zasmidium cellare ATCC 36951]
MVAISQLILLAVSATASVIPRDAATVQADLKTINTDTTTLTSKVQAYNGGAANALPIQSAENQLEKDLKSANTDAGNSAVVSATDAQSIIDYINNTLEPNIAKSIQALEAKKSNFQTDGLAGTVLTDLKNIKNETDTLGATLKTKTPAAKQSAAQAALDKIDNDLQGGINYFS